MMIYGVLLNNKDRRVVLLQREVIRVPFRLVRKHVPSIVTPAIQRCQGEGGSYHTLHAGVVATVCDWGRPGCHHLVVEQCVDSRPCLDQIPLWVLLLDARLHLVKRLIRYQALVLQMSRRCTQLPVASYWIHCDVGLRGCRHFWPVVVPTPCSPTVIRRRVDVVSVWRRGGQHAAEGLILKAQHEAICALDEAGAECVVTANLSPHCEAQLATVVPTVGFEAPREALVGQHVRPHSVHGPIRELNDKLFHLVTDHSQNQLVQEARVVLEQRLAKNALALVRLSEGVLGALLDTVELLAGKNEPSCTHHQEGTNDRRCHSEPEGNLTPWTRPS
mmetsp:Transcript_70055/g.180557  ORF Transcript_70055/g.180557 Transcript_70055/m.180557 type:complete len:332 (+) Transcript_70055:1088-2083(+)